MSNVCRRTPLVGGETFNSLKENFGHEKAVVIFEKVTGNAFRAKYGNSVTFDSDGVPSFASLMKLPIIRNFVGNEAIISSLSKGQPHLADNSANASVLIEKAHSFNETGEERDNFVAYVDYDQDFDLTIKFVPRTESSEEIAVNQYKMHKLKEAASDMLRPAGITIEDLSEIEVSAGRVGVTEFNHLSGLLNEFGVVIRVANNLEGLGAISEELAHVLVGVNRSKPLVQRSIAFLRNEEAARKVLGDDYDRVAEYYQNDRDLIAEEAAGVILRDCLIDKIDKKEDTPRPSLFKRMTNFIVGLFRGINPAHYKDTLDSIKYEYGKFAEDYLSKKKTLSKQDIQKARRVASFNALSKRIDAQIDVLRRISALQYKSASLQLAIDDGNIEDTRRALNSLGSQTKEIAKKAQETGDSMKAISKALELITKNLQIAQKNLDTIESTPTKNSFRVLENTTTVIGEVRAEIANLRTVITKEYLEDPDVMNQEFMLDDASNTLRDYESTSEPVTVDTTGKSQEEIAKMISEDSEKLTLVKDNSHYESDSGDKFLRVTSTIQSDKDVIDIITSSNKYVLPSTNIGTGMDELVRDFFMGRMTKEGDDWKVEGKTLDQVYPNATREDFNAFVDQLVKLKKRFDRNVPGRGRIHIVARDIKAMGTVQSVDGAGVVHNVNVAGTLDLLGYDDQGNWHIYDMKTHRGKIDEAKLEKWRKQLTLYKKFLEQRYGIKVKSINVIPISVSYPKPLGAGSGTAQYSVSTKKAPKEYLGTENNQLLKNGEEFRGAKPFLGSLIRNMPDLDIDPDYRKLADDPTNGLGSGLKVIHEALGTLSVMLDNLENQYNTLAGPLFAKFLAQFIGDTLEIADPDNPGKFKKVTVEDLMKESDVDLSWAQRWLATMADTPDTLLQAFDKIIKDAKHQKNLKVIALQQKILALGMKYEAKGIRSYDFMFEDDRMRYINTEYSRTAYDKAYKAKLAELDAKYGNQIGTPEYQKKKFEEQAWIEANTKPVYENGKRTRVPDKELYPSKYESLSEAQKEFYDEWIDIKAELDMYLGGRTFLTNSIKIRKSAIERLRGALKGDAISNIRESLNETFKKSFDDEVTYTHGLRDMSGKERMMLPILYLSADEKHAKDISTDVISTLIAYGDMVYQYDALSDVVDALEVGKHVLLDPVTQRKIGMRRRGLPVMERNNRGTEATIDRATIDAASSNFGKALNNLFKTKIYGRVQDESEDIILGMDAHKVANKVLKLGAYAQLGLNAFANVANIVSGIGMTNIEAFAQEYFSPKELARADKTYIKNLPGLIGDFGSRVKYNKLSLVAELFNMKANFSKNVRHQDFVNRNLITRIFGPSIQFIGQEMGDHWLYTRVGLALLSHSGITLNGKPIDSILDIFDLVPVDDTNPHAGNKLVLKEGVKNDKGEDFSEKDIVELIDKIWEMNKGLFGVYNTEDTIEARNTIMGKFLMQYRDWMPSQYRKRFGKAATSLEGGRKTEGFYRTTFRFMNHLWKDLKNGQLNVALRWQELTEPQQRNVKRALFETVQFLTILGISLMLKADKGEHRVWGKRLLAAISQRAVTELGALFPLATPIEGAKILNSPIAATSMLDGMQGLMEALWVPNWFEDVESGRYRGKSKGERGLLKSPLSGWYRQVDKIAHPEYIESYYDNK